MSSPRAEGTAGRRLLHDTPLAVRLSVLSALLAAAVVCASFGALSVQVRASARRLFAEQLAGSQRTLVALQRDRRRHLVASAALLAESPSLRSAISTYRLEHQSAGTMRRDLTATVERQLEQVGGVLNAGALLATDEQGRVLASYLRDGGHAEDGTALGTLAAVHNALDPHVTATSEDAYLSGLEVGDAYYSVGVAPLIVDGFTIGTLVFGERVDSTMVRTLRSAFDGEVVLSAGPRVLSATLADSAARRAALSRTDALSLGGEDYLAAAVPLGRTQRGTELRLTLLQPVGPSLRALTSALQRDFLLYGTLAVLLAALGAAVLARSLLHPLRRFIAFMREGAARERVDRAFDAAGAAPEIRTLNESFEGLIASLEGKRRELEQRGADLAAANEVLTDEIRERERIQGALHESESQLRQSQKLEAVGALAGGVAHDFNNLLTVISGFTQIAASRLQRDDPVLDDLRQVSDASASAAALTHQLLAFSRKQVLQPRVMDLEETVGGLAVMLRRLIGAQVELHVSHTGEPARLRADPGQLEQVVLNLAVNARDAMPDGGTLTIATSHGTRADGTRSVVLRVTDTGAGMTREIRERIFEPFFTTKEAGHGTGLGLATVYGIVVQSGGTISVESTPGHGTTFQLAFPFVSETRAPEAVADGDALVMGTGTVLVVDDNDAVRTMVERGLTACGYEVVTVGTGVEALARARTLPRVDVLLTDIVMPQMSGPQLVERFLARFPAPVVIYMTGHVNDSVMRLELDAGTVLLRKPFTPAVLARTVKAALRGVIVACALLLLSPPARAEAQGGYLVQGVADAELWKTDSASALLARNGGRPAALARVGLWAAVEPLRDVVLFGELQAETGPARTEPGSEAYLNQLGIRYSPSDAFTVEAGKVQHVVGLFATRRLSFRNPLVSAPDGYGSVYPTGLVVSGTRDRVDYRAGVLSLPLTREGYVPEAGRQYRPALGLGFTPVIGVRVGMSGSVGSYLNPGIAATELAGREWCDYHQRIVAADLQVSRGYFEANAEAARGSYDVPNAAPIAGYSGYVEGKYTFTPRLYVATRVERNDYPFIASVGGGRWVAVRSAFSDVEAAAGYRVTASTLLKLAVRADRWTPSANPGAPQANGYALVTQLSQTFDLVELARRAGAR